MQDLPKRVLVHLLRPHRNRCLNDDEAELPQVRKEDADDAKRQIDVGGDVNHRRRRLGELQYGHVLRSEPTGDRDPGVGRGDGGHEVKRLARVTRPALGHGIRPDHGASRGIEPSFVVRRHGRLFLAWSDKADRVRMWVGWWPPVPGTKTPIPSPPWPMSASTVVSTARQVPWPAADTMKNPDVISMMDWRASPPKWRLAPRASELNPAARAARCSVSACSMPREAPRARPSWERKTARVMCGTRRTRSSRTQSSWLAWYRWLLSIGGAVLRLPLRLRPALLPAALHGRQGVPHVRQGRRAGRGDASRAAGGRAAGRAKLRGQAGLADAARQAGQIATPVGVPARIPAVGRAVAPDAGAEAVPLVGVVVGAARPVGAAAVNAFAGG